MYGDNVKNRSCIKYSMGYVKRIVPYMKFKHRRNKMKKKGATVGDQTIISSKIIKYANRNLVVGNSSMIWDSLIDTRAKVKIGNNVIIGAGNTILTNSHNIDSPEWETKKYGIEIEDYVWISTNCMILPSCRHIGKGAVIGAGSVVVEDVPDFAVMSGNPAKVIKYRKCLHTNLVVESIHNGDLKIYSKIRKNKKRI